MKAEPTVQHRFIINTGLMCLLMLATVPLAHTLFVDLPNRTELGFREANIGFHKVDLDAAAFAPLLLRGAWELSGGDGRFGGLSALALDGDRFVALSDSGVVVRFGKPGIAGNRVELNELPGGPGNPRLKRNRDSEALVRDPAGRGWWVAFENRDELWLYDSDFSHPLGRISVPDRGLSFNRGSEGVAAGTSGLLLLPENGGRLLQAGRDGWTTRRIEGGRRRTSDIVAMPDESLVMVERRLTPFGFANSLVNLRRCDDGYCRGWRIRLPLGRFDNVEGIAAEPLDSGATRLWLVTDDDLAPPRRTLLIAADLPPQP